MLNNLIVLHFASVVSLGLFDIVVPVLDSVEALDLMVGK